MKNDEKLNLDPILQWLIKKRLENLRKFRHKIYMHTSIILTLKEYSEIIKKLYKVIKICLVNLTENFF